MKRRIKYLSYLISTIMIVCSLSGFTSAKAEGIEDVKEISASMNPNASSVPGTYEFNKITYLLSDSEPSTGGSYLGLDWKFYTTASAILNEESEEIEVHNVLLISGTQTSPVSNTLDIPWSGTKLAKYKYSETPLGDNPDNMFPDSRLLDEECDEAVLILDYDAAEIPQFGMFTYLGRGAGLRFEVLYGPKLDFSSVNNMGMMFLGSNLSEFSFDGLDTSSVGDMSYMFAYVSIENLEVRDWMSEEFDKGSFDSLNNVSGMFCESGIGSLYITESAFPKLKSTSLMLKGAEISEVYFSTVQFAILDTVENMFQDSKVYFACFESCSFDVLTSMSKMFSGSKCLCDVTFSDCDLTKITDMSAMFAGCSSLSYIEWGASMIPAVNNTSEMFKNCISLEYVSILDDNNGKKLLGISNFKDMFKNCEFLMNIDLSGVVFNLSKDETLLEDSLAAVSFMTPYAVVGSGKKLVLGPSLKKIDGTPVSSISGIAAADKSTSEMLICNHKNGVYYIKRGYNSKPDMKGEIHFIEVAEPIIGIISDGENYSFELKPIPGYAPIGKPLTGVFHFTPPTFDEDGRRSESDFVPNENGKRIDPNILILQYFFEPSDKFWPEFEGTTMTLWAGGKKEDSKKTAPFSIKATNYTDSKEKTKSGKLVYVVLPEYDEIAFNENKHTVTTKSSSEAKKIASISGKGEISAKSPGTVYVYACDTGSFEYEAIEVEVKGAATKIIFKENPEDTKKAANPSVAVGDSAAFYIEALCKKAEASEDCHFTVESSETGVAAASIITSGGALMLKIDGVGIKNGKISSAKIEVTNTESGKKGKISVKVSNPVLEIAEKAAVTVKEKGAKSTVSLTVKCAAGSTSTDKFKAYVCAEEPTVSGKKVSATASSQVKAKLAKDNSSVEISASKDVTETGLALYIAATDPSSKTTKIYKICDINP